MERLGAKHRAVRRNSLYLHIAQGRRCEHVTSESSDRRIRNRERRSLRQVNGAAGCRNAGSLHGKLGSDREIIIVSRDNRVVKDIGRFRRGHDHQGGANRSLIAVGGTIQNGDGLRALRLASKGRGASAVEIRRDDAARVQHDLGNFDRAAADRIRILTAVEHHEHDLSVIGNADGSARCTVIVVIGICGDGNLPVSDEPDVDAYRLLNLILKLIPFGFSTHNGRAVLEDGEEVLAADVAVLHTLHHQCTGRSAVAHVVEIGVRADHSAVVWNVMLRIVRIGVPRFGGCHLVGHAGHGPV